MNKGKKNTRNVTNKKASKNSNPKFKWIVKGKKNSKHEPQNLVHSKPTRNLVHSEPPQNIVPPGKVVIKQPSVEYDFWINKNTMTFCFSPKETRKEHSKTSPVQKPKDMSKAHAKAPKPNTESKKLCHSLILKILQYGIFIVLVQCT